MEMADDPNTHITASSTPAFPLFSLPYPSLRNKMIERKSERERIERWGEIERALVREERK